MGLNQEWRKGRREDMIHEPKKLTEALDIVLAQVSLHKQCPICDAYCAQCANPTLCINFPDSIFNSV